MIQQPNDLGLRPIPGPEPVQLNDATVWLWLIPAVLVGFLLFWWSRPGRKHPPNPQDLLNDAIAACQDQTLTTTQRLDEVQHALRQYLAWRHEPAWLAASSRDVSALWSILLPENLELAEKWNTHWELAETYLFDYKTCSVEQLAAYVKEIERLEEHLDAKMKVA